jgi:hypothetical protein
MPMSLVLPFMGPYGRGTTPAISLMEAVHGSRHAQATDLGPPSWKQNTEECKTPRSRICNTMRAFREGFLLSAAALAHRTRAGVRVVRHVCSRSLEALHAAVARRNMCSGAWRINPHTEADQECLHSKFSQNSTVAEGHGGAS